MGDVLTHRDVARLRRLAPKVTPVNLYGTTETQRALGFFVVSPDQAVAQRDPIPLGRGMPDVQLLILNAAGQLAGVGELGEIHVRSPHLARGYLKDADLTRARFGTNSFTGDAADRWYRTGDQGRYRPDGTVEFVGRTDGQVKIRAFRVELAEVERLLEQHPLVRQAVAMVREDRPGDRRLVAYVVTGANVAPPSHDLRDFLRERLPAYMVPSTLVALERLPLTPSGKVDRQALPSPAEIPVGAGGEARLPTTPMERIVAGIWRDILGVEQVGVDDTFFDLGGHSLLAMQVLDRLEKATGVRGRPRDLFLQSLGQLASACDRQAQASKPSGEPGLLRKVLTTLTRSLPGRTVGNP